MRMIVSIFIILFSFIFVGEAFGQNAAGTKPAMAATSAAPPQAQPAPPAAGAAPPAGAAASNTGSTQGQWATVKTDNALVYEQPDFDAATLMYLQAGRKIRVSKKIFGSYFKFYQVKVSATKLGYITTIDVVPEKGAPTTDKPVAKNAKNPQKKKKGKQANSKSTTGKYPPVKAFIQTKYMGIFIGIMKYSETIPGVNASTNLLIYGIKITGPHTFVTLPTDFNLVIHYGAPSYYNSFSTSESSGFVMLVDWLMLFPFLDRPFGSFYIGLGPLLDISSFQFGTTAGISGSTEVTIGLSAEIGYGIKLGRDWAGRAEYKQMWDRANYNSYGISVQNRF